MSAVEKPSLTTPCLSHGELGGLEPGLLAPWQNATWARSLWTTSSHDHEASGVKTTRLGPISRDWVIVAFILIYSSVLGLSCSMYALF